MIFKIQTKKGLFWPFYFYEYFAISVSITFIHSASLSVPSYSAIILPELSKICVLGIYET